MSIAYDLNLNFKPPKRPFKRINHSDTIVWRKEHNIKKQQGTFHEFGKDIPETPERLITDIINETIFLCQFPLQIKSFYIQQCPEDSHLTESVDLLMSNVGEIVRGSIHTCDGEEMLAGYEMKETDHSPLLVYRSEKRQFMSSWRIWLVSHLRCALIPLMCPVLQAITNSF